MRLLSSVLLMLMLVLLLRACAAVQRPIRDETSRVESNRDESGPDSRLQTLQTRSSPRPSINSNPLADMSSLFFGLPPELLQSA